jgi:pyridoxine 5-phosphate synthase
MPKLGVNIDHVATLRELRRSKSPDILYAARVCESAGADSIVVHLREDRRHIQDKDVFDLRRTVNTKLNLEMSIAKEIVSIAAKVGPDQATFVPEKRQELTTEGGLDVVKLAGSVAKAAHRLKKRGILVSLFIEPNKYQIQACRDIGVEMVEFHTGVYANSKRPKESKIQLAKLRDAAAYAHELGLIVNAGHGLDYVNVCPVARMDYMEELNIGYSIICYSLFVGLEKAVCQMKELIEERIAPVGRGL